MKKKHKMFINVFLEDVKDASSTDFSKIFYGLGNQFVRFSSADAFWCFLVSADDCKR